MMLIIELALIALLVVGLLVLLMQSLDLITRSFGRLKRYLHTRFSYRNPLRAADSASGSHLLSRSMFKTYLHALRRKQKRFAKALQSVENPFVNTQEVATGVNELVDTMRQRIERAQRITAHVDLSDEAITKLKREIGQIHREIGGTPDEMARDAKVAAANHKAAQLRTLAEIKTVTNRLRADLIRLDAFIDDIQTRVLGMDLLGRKDAEFKEIKDLFERINSDIAAAENIEEEFYRDLHAGPTADVFEEPLYLRYRSYWDRTAKE